MHARALANHVMCAGSDGRCVLRPRACRCDTPRLPRCAGVFGVLKMLGLDQPPESYWDAGNQTVTRANGAWALNPPPQQVGWRAAAAGASGRQPANHSLVAHHMAPTATTPPRARTCMRLAQFALWAKTNVIAGRPVIGAFRVYGERRSWCTQQESLCTRGRRHRAAA